MRLPRILLLILLLPTAAAFSSVPPEESPHDEITKEAAEAADYPEEGTKALQEAVRKSDLDDMELEGDQIETTESYRPEHHCERTPPTDNESAFREATAYIHQQTEEAAEWKNAEAAVEALGRALHAAQDCFSHSNYVELERDDQERFRTALLENEEPPAGIILVAFDPDAEEPGSPDDPYPHDKFAKDSPEYNRESQRQWGERTKYEHAHGAAAQVSSPLIAAFLGPLTTEQRDALEELDASNTTPAPGGVVLGVVVVALCVLVRQVS